MSKKRPTVLVVDDSDICLQVAEDALEAAGFEVVTSNTPLGASRLLRQSSADCAVIDVSMPAMTGDRLVEILRRAVGGVPLLLHSDRPLPELTSLAQPCGAAAAVSKTSDCKPLVEEVRRVLARRGRS